ncbi:MAG: hypothetical protein RL685_839 [Pseudomonadota bacterium]|jgi:hypothetical protein
MTTQAADSPGLATRPLHPAITTDACSFEAAARAAERVEVVLQSPGPEHRTKLSAFVLASIEAQLERLGAAPAGYGPRDSLETSLSDQLYRSRLLGAGGIALSFVGLDGIADVSGGLSVEDSHVLRRMFAFAELEPLQVLLPEQSARLRVLGEPQRLQEWLPAASLGGRVAQIEYEPLSLPSSLPPSSLPPSAAEDSAALAPPDPAAFLELPRADTEAPVTSSSATVPGMKRTAPELECVADPNEHERPTVVPAVVPTDPDAIALASSQVDSSPPPADEAELTPEQSAEQQRRCAAWLAQLRSMNGPKQHASVERAFVSAYLPLAREVASGSAPQEVRSAVDSWAEGFAQSYASAFKTLAGHARRPTMVRDIFDVALRWLNQCRARTCQILLVDCMRFDLGQRLNEEIERRLAGHAVCRDQALLWAALPSNSVAQRLADGGQRRGAAAAREGAPRGIEPLRVGSRDLCRLDCLASELARPGEPETHRLDRLAQGLADVIVPWLKSLTPDTLVVVFGDHGFHWQANALGTSTAQRGGALPEQVLVPASAWLLGSHRAKAGTSPGLH